MSLVKPGKYAAHPERLCEEKFADVYENQNGNLILLMAYRMEDSGHVMKHWTTLAIQGEVKLRTIEDLKARFGWDGVDPWWFETADGLSEVPVELVIEDEPDKSDPRKVWSRIKWVNTPGGRGGTYAAKGDKRALGAKYGALFRAVAGPQPVKPAAQPPAATPPPRSVAPKPEAKADAAPSDLNACWQTLCGVMAGESEDSKASNWYALLEQTIPGKTQDDFSPTDWGQVMRALGEMKDARDQIPM